jgi:hypothetical protein
MITPISKSFHAEMMARVPYRSEGLDLRMQYHEVDWNNLEFVGAGAYGIVFKTDKYAVKIGSIAVGDVEDLIKLVDVRRSVPVYGFWSFVQIPTWFIAAGEQYSTNFSDTTSIKKYVQKVKGTLEYRADVMVMGLATPLFSHCAKITRKEEDRIASSARYLFWLLWKKHGYYWADAHIGNIGRIGRRLIVLDT